MSHRVRGAASVNVMWVIFLLVLLISAGGAIWVFASAQAEHEQNVKTADARLAKIVKINSDLMDELREVSALVGYRNVDDPSSNSSAPGMRDAIANAKTNNEFLGESVTTLETVIEGLAAEAGNVAAQNVTLDQERVAAHDARDSWNDQLLSAQSSARDEKKSLEDQLSAQTDLAEQRESSAESKADSFEQKLTEAEARESALHETMETEVTRLMGELRHKQGRIEGLSKKIEIFRNPEEVDGEVIAVSPDLGIAYIDLGRKDLLRRGTRFKVHRDVKGGVRQPMGVVEVRSLREDRAECGIVEMYDEFDPIAPGDKIVAPLFDVDLVREFVLIGRFPAGFPKDLVADRLRSLGAKVNDSVSATTDFLVVGDTEFMDPDSDESGNPADTDDYRLAVEYKVQLLPVRELLDFMKYD